MEENVKATVDEVVQVLQVFTDATVGMNAATSENTKPVSTHLQTHEGMHGDVL